MEDERPTCQSHGWCVGKTDLNRKKRIDQIIAEPWRPIGRRIPEDADA